VTQIFDMSDDLSVIQQYKIIAD